MVKEGGDFKYAIGKIADVFMPAKDKTNTGLLTLQERADLAFENPDKPVEEAYVDYLAILRGDK
jgi:hypothetical protein